MYTLVFNSKCDGMIVFDVYQTQKGTQQIIGNIFCTKENKNSRYKANSLLQISSVPENRNIISFEDLTRLYQHAESICNSHWMNT